MSGPGPHTSLLLFSEHSRAPTMCKVGGRSLGPRYSRGQGVPRSSLCISGSLSTYCVQDPVVATLNTDLFHPLPKPSEIIIIAITVIIIELPVCQILPALTCCG